MGKYSDSTTFILQSFEVESGKKLDNDIFITDSIKARHEAETLRAPKTTILTKVINPSMNYKYEEVDEDIQNQLLWEMSRDVGK